MFDLSASVSVPPASVPRRPLTLVTMQRDSGTLTVWSDPHHVALGLQGADGVLRRRTPERNGGSSGGKAERAGGECSGNGGGGGELLHGLSWLGPAAGRVPVDDQRRRSDSALLGESVEIAWRFESAVDGLTVGPEQIPLGSGFDPGRVRAERDGDLVARIAHDVERQLDGLA